VPKSPAASATVGQASATQSTKLSPHHHYQTSSDYCYNNYCVSSSPVSTSHNTLSPQHFNNLVSKSVHINMAVHSSSLEPPQDNNHPLFLPEFPPQITKEITI